MHDAHDLGAVSVVDTVVDLFAALFAHQQFRIAQDLQVMRDGRAADLEQARDVVDADFLAGLEYQQDLLASGVAKRGKEAGESFPALGQAISEFGVHATT